MLHLAANSFAESNPVSNGEPQIGSQILLQRHRAPRGVLVPGEDGQVIHLSVAQGFDDGLRALQVGDERDARVHRPATDVVSIGTAELVVLDGYIDHQVDKPLLDGIHARHCPVFGALGELGALDTHLSERLGGAVRGVELEPHVLRERPRFVGEQVLVGQGAER
jgi:hypothetical protein